EQQQNEKHEVTVALQLRRAIGILDEEIDGGGELVAERNGEEIRAHDKRFEFDRPLGVGKLEVSRRNQRFARGQNYERPDLRGDARACAAIDLGLNDGDYEK